MSKHPNAAERKMTKPEKILDRTFKEGANAHVRLNIFYAVVAMRERKGRMKAMAVDDADMATLHTKIHQHVAAGSTLHTDEAGVYRGLGGLFFNHETVNHSEGEYVRDGVTTNSVESVFAVLKRGLIGVYHHASKKHLSRYVDEFAFRLNDGRVQRHTLERLESFVGGTKGKRLTYKGLIQ